MSDEDVVIGLTIVDIHNLLDRCESGEFYSDYDGDLELLRKADAALTELTRIAIGTDQRNYESGYETGYGVGYEAGYKLAGQEQMTS